MNSGLLLRLQAAAFQAVAGRIKEDVDNICVAFDSGLMRPDTLRKLVSIRKSRRRICCITHKLTPCESKLASMIACW